MSKRQRYQMSSTVFVMLRRGTEFCAIKRVHTGWMDGHDSLPAGAVEQGETLQAAAIREAAEEVGVRIEPSALRLVHTLHCRTHGEGWIGHFFSVEIWEGTPTICEPHKHAELRWMTVGDISKPFVPYVKTALLAISRGEQFSAYGFDV